MPLPGLHLLDAPHLHLHGEITLHLPHDAGESQFVETQDLRGTEGQRSPIHSKPAYPVGVLPQPAPLPGETLFLLPSPFSRLRFGWLRPPRPLHAHPARPLFLLDNPAERSEPLRLSQAAVNLLDVSQVRVVLLQGFVSQLGNGDGRGLAGQLHKAFRRGDPAGQRREMRCDRQNVEGHPGALLLVQPDEFLRVSKRSLELSQHTPRLDQFRVLRCLVRQMLDLFGQVQHLLPFPRLAVVLAQVAVHIAQDTLLRHDQHHVPVLAGPGLEPLQARIQSPGLSQVGQIQRHSLVHGEQFRGVGRAAFERLPRFFQQRKITAHVVRAGLSKVHTARLHHVVPSADLALCLPETSLALRRKKFPVEIRQPAIDIRPPQRLVAHL